MCSFPVLSISSYSEVSGVLLKHLEKLPSINNELACYNAREIALFSNTQQYTYGSKVL